MQRGYVSILLLGREHKAQNNKANKRNVKLHAVQKATTHKHSQDPTNHNGENGYLNMIPNQRQTAVSDWEP